MGVFEAIVVFVISWWLVLLPILSAGTRSQEEAGVISPGTERAAPVRPRLVPKLMIATLGATALTALLWVTLYFGWIDFVNRPA
ncbi:MAG: DUF1467 family protein [Alphaproteobacteria bacterium]|mgnify:CR=1 FL=1|nr:DUF1467 family protein [Alphaproteobacteria bacterium]